MARWHEVKTFVGRVFAPFRKGRLTTLAALVVGLLRKQQVGLAAIAQGMLDGTTGFLVTNLDLDPVLVQRIYAKRMWIEEGICDCKTGLGLKRLWLSTPERMDRMMILVAIAMLLILLTGAASLRRGERPQVTTSKKKALPASLFTLGTRLLYLRPERLCTQEEILYAL